MFMIWLQEENASGINRNHLEDTTVENEETDLHGPEAASQVRKSCKGVRLGCQ